MPSPYIVTAHFYATSGNTRLRSLLDKPGDAEMAEAQRLREYAAEASAIAARFEATALDLWAKSETKPCP